MKKRAKRKPPKRSRRNARSQSPSTAIVSVRPPAPKPWELTSTEVDLVKNTICKGATNEELAYCLTTSRHYRLDPFKKQIWFIPRFDKNAERPDGGKGMRLWVAQVSMDGLRHIGARDHKDFGTEDPAEYGPMVTVEWSNDRKSGKIRAPEWARVSVWKKGADRPTVGEVYWEEIYPEIGNSPMVRQMPRLMLGKCASAQANRKAYPETGGLYIPEEFAGQRPDYTPEGRLIEYHDHQAPREDPRERAQKVLADKLAGKMPLHGAQEAQDASAKPQAPEPQKPPIDVPAQPAQEQPRNKGVIEIDHTASETHPIIRGDIALAFDWLTNQCGMKWDDDAKWNRVPARAVESIRQMAFREGYEFKEIVPKSSPPPPEGKKAASSPPVTSPGVTGVSPGSGRQGKGKGSSASGQPDSPAAEPKEVKGIIERVNHVTTRNQQMMAFVTLNIDRKKHDYSSFDKDINQFLEAGKGKQAVLYIQNQRGFLNIVGLKSVGALEFVDGKIPVIHKDREAGTPKLWQ